MDLQQIKYILAVAEEGNITKAAQRMFISQPAMSQQVLKLERELGTPLFKRSGRTLEITEAGRIYINTAIAILSIEKSFLKEEEQYAHNTKTLRIAVGIEVPDSTADKLLFQISKKQKIECADVFYSGDKDFYDMQHLLLEDKADIVISSHGKNKDTDVKTLAVISEHFSFLYFGKKEKGKRINAWLSPEIIQRRKMEEQALELSEIKVTVTGTCEIPTLKLLQRTDMGAFIANSQIDRKFIKERALAEFTQDFSARALIKE